MTESHIDSISVRDNTETNKNIDSMKQTQYKKISYTFNGFSSSNSSSKSSGGNPNIDYDTESQTNADPNKKMAITSSNWPDEITEQQQQQETNTEAIEPIVKISDNDNDDYDNDNDDPKKPTEITERMDTLDVDQLYMDDGAATDGGAAAAAAPASTEDFHDDEPEAAADTVRVEMLKIRQPFFPDDDEDDDDEGNDDGDGKAGGGSTDHSGDGAIDKYGDYENDNVRDRLERPYKHNKSGFSHDGKTHENDDFDRHPFSQSSSVKSDSKDAIKIISTPLGKVSIIYQSNTNNGSSGGGGGGGSGAIAATSNADSKLKLFENSNQNSMNKFKNFYNHNINAGAKQQNLTHQHRSTIKNREHHRHNHHYPHHQQPSAANANGAGGDVGGAAAAPKGGRGTNQMNDKTKLLQKQITPVLTADGKVALLYRGAQDTIGQHKIEIGKNLTDFSRSINNSPDGISSNGKLNYNIVSEGVLPDKLPEIIGGGETNVATNQTERIATKNMEKLAVIVAAETTTTTTRTKLTTFAPIANTERPILRLFKSDENTSSRNTNEEENSILPNINRPPSEVLGIKKNQFTQFRITDLIATATPTLTNQDFTEKTPLSSYGNERPKQIGSLGNGNEHGRDAYGADVDAASQPPQSPNFDYDYNGHNHENHYPNHLATPSIDFDGGAPSSSHGSIDDSTTISDVLSKAEVVNLAIIPAFESDLHRFHEQQQNDVLNDNNPYYNMMDRDDGGGSSTNDIGIAGKQHKHRHHNVKDLSALHCAMQALVAVAALATVFGMLGAYFKQRILDQLTIMHW